ncbi:MAG: hypothetical protein ABR589_00960 [Chthoniobacterales bacterium]
MVAPASFQRANPRRPIAKAAIYYNDAAGIRAMIGGAQMESDWPILPTRFQSLVSVGLRDQSGRILPGTAVGKRWFVVGEVGRRYSIVLRNQTHLRLEAVLSVDGLDVLDGRTASLLKRGYIVAPRRQLVVEGFRRSSEAVAAFRFSSVRDSYAAQKYGDTGNVGVIGVAIFNEVGTDPWSDSEVRKRLNADPFPERFATPP